MKVPRKKRIWPRVLTSFLLITVVLLAAAACLAATLSLEVQLNGEENILLQYGQSYTDQGAVAVLKSSLFGSFNMDIPVQADTADIRAPGEYTVRYSAGFWWLQHDNQRYVTVEDRVAPTITLISVPGSYTLPGREYAEEGYVASDNCDGDITDKVQRTQTETEVIYTVTDSSGNTAEARRPIVYDDPEPPVLTLEQGNQIVATLGRPYTDPGFTAVDNADGDITDQVTVTGSIDTFTLGTYIFEYTVTDAYGNTSTAIREVSVEPAKQPDVVDPGDKVVYLTFDDGPGPYTDRLLDILAKYDVKATFFVCDKGETHNRIMQRIVAEGHSIGVHSYSHVYKEIYASEEAFLSDFNAIRQIILEQTGVDTTLFRFPGGSSNTISRRYNKGIMTRLAQLMTDFGYQYFDWNITSGDTDGLKTAEEVSARVIDGMQKKSVSVVLQHDVKEYSVDAVELILQWGLENGYTFLPLEATSPVFHNTINN